MLNRSIFIDIHEDATSPSSTLEITFNQALSECVNGTQHRDFAWRTIAVDDPKLNGETMQFEQVENGDRRYVRYISKVKPRLAEYDFTFSIDGQVFETDPKRLEIQVERLRIYTKPRSTK